MSFLLFFHFFITVIDISSSKMAEAEKDRSAEMLKFDLNAEICKKSEEANYDPQKDTNWCNLPMEMRDECVKRMDFETRMRLRYSSRIERILVDSWNCTFRTLRFLHSTKASNPNVQVGVYADKDDRKPVIRMQFDPRSEADSLLPGLLLKTGKFEKIDVNLHTGTELGHLEKFAPFRFETLRSFDMNSAFFFLKNAYQGVKRIHVDNLPSRSSLSGFFDIPAVINAKFLDIFALEGDEPVENLVKNWINNNVKTGTNFSVDRSDMTIDSFAEKFADRITSRSKMVVVFRTNVPEVHIELRFRAPSCGFRFSVIPAENH